MAASAGDSLGDQSSRALEKHELQLWRCCAKDVAIRSLERGAGHHQSGAGLLCLADSGGERAKPVDAIGVSECNSPRHALHILGGVVRIPFNEVDAERIGERGAD